MAMAATDATGDALTRVSSLRSHCRHAAETAEALADKQRKAAAPRVSAARDVFRRSARTNGHRRGLPVCYYCYLQHQGGDRPMTKTDYFQRVRIAAGSCSEMPTNTASLPMAPPPTGSTEHAAAFHIPHTTTVATTLEPDLDYLGHRYVLRALILEQQRHFVTISRRWCGRPRGPMWLYQDSIHKPEPVLTAIARRQDQRGVTRTETDPTTKDFHTLCRLVKGAFRGLLYTLEVPMPPSPQPDATEDSPTHQHVAESSTPDDPGPTADHHHLGPAARATAGPNPATTRRKRPPPDDMTERRGAQRGKLIPGV